MGGEKLKSFLPEMGFIFALFLVFSFFFCAEPPLSAQTTDVSPPASPSGVDQSAFILGEPSVVPVPSGASSIFVVLRMVLVLALAALAIYGVVFFIKRLARPQENRDPHLKVLAKVPLGNDTFAAVLSVGPKAWLVAGGSGGVNLVSEIDDTETLETMLLDDARKIAEAGNRPLIDFRSLTASLRKQGERLKRP